MRVKILCNKEELARMDDIQEIFNESMYKLVELGLKGNITIEKDDYTKDCNLFKLCRDGDKWAQENSASLCSGVCETCKFRGGKS